MDELSWRAKLAKSNINILGIDKDRWFYEFMYHPKYGQTKWCKTYYKVPEKIDVPEADPVQWIKFSYNEDDIAEAIRAEVLALRKELEG